MDFDEEKEITRMLKAVEHGEEGALDSLAPPPSTAT